MLSGAQRITERINRLRRQLEEAQITPDKGFINQLACPF